MTRAELITSEKLWKARHAYRDKKVRTWGRRRAKAHAQWEHLAKTLKARDPKRVAAYHKFQDAVTAVHKWEKKRDEATHELERRRHQVVALKPLREKAYEEAERFIGVMEKGGNNTGPEVAKFIRANGGIVGEPWCGDFQAYVYRRAGSKAVNRLWASVRALGGVFGIKRVSQPQRGDLVRFTFDHVGMFVRDLGNGMIETIEGNTGASGAVSDSSTGGDGVYRKQRPKSQVADYLRVTR